MANKHKPKPNPCAIIYARFSPRPEDKVKISESIEFQVEACRNYCAAKGYEVLAVHSDRALSGRDNDRPGLQDAIDDVIGARGILVAHSLTRIARSVVGADEIFRRITRAGGDVAVLDMNIDTATAVGRLLLDLMIRIAQFEREQTGERVSAAMRRYQRNGRAVGSTPPYGWRFGGDITLPNGEARKSLVEDEHEQAVRGRIIGLVNEGRSLRHICGLLNAEGVRARGSGWHPNTIARIVRAHEDARDLVAVTA